MSQVFELNVQNLQQLQRQHQQDSFNHHFPSEFERSADLEGCHPECGMIGSLHSLLVSSEGGHTPDLFYKKIGAKDHNVSSLPSSEMESVSSGNESEDEGIYPPDLEFGLIHTDVIAVGDDKVIWETHHVAVYKEAGLGFGIAISGGRDNPHFSSGETSIAVSGVLKGGPADGQLKANDRVISINGISMEDASHAEAISLLRESGEMVDLLIKRKVFIPSPHKRQERTITIDKTRNCADVGVEVGCKFFVKDIKSGSATELNGDIERGDYILKVNDQLTENLTFAQTQRLIDRSKGKLKLLLERPPKPLAANQSSHGYSTSQNIYQWTMQQQAASSGYSSPTASLGGRSRANSKLSASEESRYVTYMKENNSTGLCIVGGNKTGVYISSVEGGGPAQREGLREGDFIIQINGVPIQGLTREQVFTRMESLPEKVDLLVVDRMEEYSRLFIHSCTDSGDEFYVRANITYNAVKSHSTKSRLSIKPGEIFKVVDTLPSDHPGCWVAVRMSCDGEGLEKGIIPNRGTADQLYKTSNSSLLSSKEYSKSFGKEQWQNVILDGSSMSNTNNAYEKVVLQEAYLPRPVVIYGALSELCRNKLIAMYHNQFEVPSVTKIKTGFKSKNVLKFSSIQTAADKGKHCILDLPPHAMDKLIHSQFCPIVIHVSSDTAELQDSKLSRSIKKLDQLCEKIETDYPQLISAHVNVVRGRDWLQQVCDVIAREQEKAIWISEGVSITSPSYCSSDYFSLDSSHPFGSRVDLQRTQYDSLLCLHDGRRERSYSNVAASPTSATGRLRSSTDPYRGIDQPNSLSLEKLSPLSRSDSLPPASKSHNKNQRPCHKHRQVKADVHETHYDNSGFLDDEEGVQRPHTDARNSRGIWYTERSLSHLGSSASSGRRTTPVINEIEMAAQSTSCRTASSLRNTPTGSSGLISTGL